MQHQDRLAGWIADRCVMQLQFGQRLTGVKLEIFGDEVAFFRRGIIRCVRGYACEQNNSKRGSRGGMMQFHVSLPKTGLASDGLASRYTIAKISERRIFVEGQGIFVELGLTEA
jgi:hypothetical protein